MITKHTIINFHECTNISRLNNCILKSNSKTPNNPGYWRTTPTKLNSLIYASQHLVKNSKSFESFSVPSLNILTTPKISQTLFRIIYRRESWINHSLSRICRFLVFPEVWGRVLGMHYSCDWQTVADSAVGNIAAFFLLSRFLFSREFFI